MVVKKSDESLAHIVQDTTIDEFAASALKEYGEHTIFHRAIVCVSDGLLPVHRSLLWTAKIKGISSSGPTKKSAAIVGTVLGEFHPHGDESIYKSLVRLVKMKPALFDGQGGFGSAVTGDPPSAMRYTEVRLSKFSEKVVLNPDYLVPEVIPMIDNYDGTTKEPLVLPSLLPGFLVFGSEGIGVGARSKLPTFEVASVIDVLSDIIENKRIDPDRISVRLRQSASEGGNFLSGRSEVKDWLISGSATFRYECDHEFDAKKKVLSIKSGAHRWSWDVFQNAVSALPDIKAIDEISDPNSTVFQARISFGRNVGDGTIERAIQLLRSSASYNSNVITRQLVDVGGMSEVSSKFIAATPLKVISYWLKWRADLERRSLRHKLDGLSKTRRRQALILLVIKNLKEVLRAIRNSDAKRALIELLDISEEEAGIILDFRIRQMTRTSETETLAEISRIDNLAKSYMRSYKDPYGTILGDLPALNV